ncbi:MAG: LTA synthase family protein [Pseudomonadales bacterium]|nr:LTA synthase family protein [Pseudomonadales bacterium]
MLINLLWEDLSVLGPYAPLLLMAVIGLVLLTCTRFALVMWKWQRVMNTGKCLPVFLQGLRADVILLSLLCLIPVLLSPLCVNDEFWPVWSRFTLVWVVSGLTVLFFLEVITPGFINEYDLRPNRLFVEYLKYPKEVLPMLWKGFRIHIFIGLLIPALVAWVLILLMQPWLEVRNQLTDGSILLIWPFLLLALVLAIRSTTGHRPANPAMFAITSDAMVNSLVLNSFWSVLHAIYNFRHEKKTSAIYGKMPLAEVLDVLNEERAGNREMADFLGDRALPSLNLLQPSRQRQRPLNLVIVLEESLGATYVGSLGGLAVTPELEKLKSQGWWFEQLYATGTRSVRGIEALVSGFPPTPAQAAVKLSLSQQNFFTLATLLGRQGYHSEFIYGGESHFDNMNGFFRGNGFQHITDQKDFSNPVFTGSWGVSDEDLLGRAHENLSALHAQGTPFFTLVFTSSNHSPFEFPDGRIELHDSKKATEANAVKYADYALGQFFARARASDYWQDTLFIVVADHDIKVRGESLVPVKNFHIPALILGADIEPRRIASVCSQIDLPVTALSLMGIKAQHPMPGRDLSRVDPDYPGRALMQFEDNYAFMEGDKVVILRPGQSPVHARYCPSQKSLSFDNVPDNATALERRALANAMLPSLLYQAQQYNLGDVPNGKAMLR